MAAADSRSPDPYSPRPGLINFLRDDRVLQIAGQIIFAIVLIALLYGLVTSIFAALAAKNLTPNLAFLQNRAGFDIGEKPAWFGADSSYWQAYTVGLTNTLRIVVVGLVLSTVLGVFVGIFLLSTNWLVKNISAVYVELLRNTPLLLQLIVWYYVVMLSLPSFQQSLAVPQEGFTFIPIRLLLYAVAGLVVWRTINGLPPKRHNQRRYYVWGWLALVVVAEVIIRIGIIGDGGAIRLELQPWIFLNIRGFAFPEVQATARLGQWLAFVFVGLALALVLWVYYGRLKETSGLAVPRTLYAVVAVVGAAVIGWLIISSDPTPTTIPVVNADGQTTLMSIDDAREQGLISADDEKLYAATPLLFQLPEKSNFRYTAGTQISPEYMALLLGLSIYTSAFIAEIVRAGILAVPRGQVEAARALGLSGGDVLRLVILPQALRVIIPPLGNQYLNLAKNSSLAIAIAYADLFQITTTIMNQSGQSVTGMLMVMLTYLIISLTIAAVMGRANRRFQLVTR